MCDTEIIAKTNPKETLWEHTEKCLNVFQSIRECYQHIPEQCGVEHFFKHLFCAVALHDIGKVAQGFQNSLTSGNPWGYRHEILSAGFVSCIPMLKESERKAISLAIISHHKNISEIRERFGTTSPLGREHFHECRNEILANFHLLSDFFETINLFSKKYFGKNGFRFVLPNSIEDIIDVYQYGVLWYRHLLDEDSHDFITSHYGIFLRGLLMACDHLASAGKQHILETTTNISAALSQFNLYSYQERVKQTKGSIFLSAPTGSGKTEAALLWSESNSHKGTRIFYVLPYTASINAMGERLTNYFGNESIAILHGKASYFVYKTLLDDNCDSGLAANSAREIQNISKKIYRPIKVVTPFQLLKAFFSVKGWEIQISEMSGALFIFDEIHAYDPHIIALIICMIEYLSNIDGRFLFLSATFPDFLRTKIRNVLPEIRNFDLDENIENDRNLLLKPRHKINILPGEITDHLDKIQSELNAQKRVLVVCNTVKRAQEIYRTLQPFAQTTELLHGRFILKDREEKERVLGDVQLLVGTQAIEVSLDLDFDIGFIEPAPIDALVQRLGRINRRGTKGIVPVYVSSSGSDKDRYFYDMQRVERTLAALKDGEELTEKRVIELVNEVYKNGYNEREEKVFLSAKTAFEYIIKNLHPFDDTDDKEDFYNLIRTIEVIPIRFESDYLLCKQQNRHFDAMRYSANISLGQGAMLRKSKRLSKGTDGHWVADARYDEFGLHINEIETDIGNID